MSAPSFRLSHRDGESRSNSLGPVLPTLSPSGGSGAATRGALKEQQEAGRFSLQPGVRPAGTTRPSVQRARLPACCAAVFPPIRRRSPGRRLSASRGPRPSSCGGFLAHRAPGGVGVGVLVAEVGGAPAGPLHFLSLLFC